MKRKTILGFIVALLVFAGVMLFIRSSNDHAECGNAIIRQKDSDGNLVTVTKHVCKEKFNF